MIVHGYLLIHDTQPSLTYCKKEVTKEMEMENDDLEMNCEICLKNS